MIKIFADGADKASILEMNKNPLIQGFTTNPTLLRKAGVTDFKAFAQDLLSEVTDKPISFEVFSDDWDEMKRQALEIASWGPNVYVKIPVMNTKGESSEMLIEDLNWSGIKINVTAITTFAQARAIFTKLKYKRGAYLSIFAGRIADTSRSPLSVIMEAVEMVYGSEVEIIWASPREVLNITQADTVGCHIITCGSELIKKYMALKEKDLMEYSRETVQMFYNDAQSAGYTI